MRIKLELNDRPILYNDIYLEPVQILDSYRELAPGRKIKFICKLIDEINTESYSIAQGLNTNWADHPKETSDAAIDLLKRLIEEYDHYKNEKEK